MPISPELQQFAEDLQQDIVSRAELDGNEGLRRDAFTERCFEVMADAGEIDDGQVCFHRAHGLEVSGYNVEEDEGLLNLTTTIYRGDPAPESVTKTDLDSAFRKLQTFLRKAQEKYYSVLEEASPAFDMAQQIYRLRSSISRVRLAVLTDGLASDYARVAESTDGVEVSFAVWDLARLFRCETSGRRQEPIEIDFEQAFGEPIPCLATPSPGRGDYKAYLVIIPARVLYTLYDKYRDRLLELNVRSFLQARGKVNQGIRETINETPDRFLAYNNGITATAEKVELVGRAGGGLGIKSLRNLQIVNGGQTTASIHHAVSKDGANIDAIFVQGKVVVVSEQQIQSIVPLISRYSNSQNKIQEADFSANDEFHVRLQELSRTVWAPSPEGTSRQTRWFYERARGQYQDALGHEGTAARKRHFKVEHPTSQKFTKTDLAKFVNTWEQLPHIVSLGAQKNFREFTLLLKNRPKFLPDQTYFQRLVAKAILFRGAERVIGDMKLGGYRANVVAYTIAYLSHRTAKAIDLDEIWRKQRFGTEVKDAIVAVGEAVHRTIVNPPGGKNVTEWCKKEACWKAIRELDLRLPASFDGALLSSSAASAQDQAITSIAEQDGQAELIARIRLVSGETWFDISRWAKETDTLAPWQRSLAFSLGRLANARKAPSVKQAVQAEKILDEAAKKGYRVTD